MKKAHLFFLFALIVLAACTETVDYSTQVKPILNKNCITCHGGVKQSGGFSLLFREEALAVTESGKPAIIPGDVNCEFVKRITHSNPEERMPYKHEPLASDEIKILTQWIKQGANWGKHWAYDSIPVDLPSQSIDHFIQTTLKEKGVEPADEAPAHELIRRLSFDITGLPPTPQQVQRYQQYPHDSTYQNLVSEMIATPAYGEKWASWWLDLARYSDTKGYEKDGGREIWRYRDWVIQAFNNDKPFNAFTIEQLAGDLLPNPTDDQLTATAFHRNTMNNDEGGTDDEEFRVSTVLERVNTTWTVWQSTTMACVQCHSHPYDPIRHKEYYNSMAVFNNQRDEDTEGEHPKLNLFKPEDEAKLNGIVEWVKKQSGEAASQEARWFLKTGEPKIHAHDFDDYVNGALADTKWLAIRSGGRARLKQIDLSDKRILLINGGVPKLGGFLEIRLDKPDGEIIAHASLDGLKENKTTAITLKDVDGKHDLYFGFRNPALTRDQYVSFIGWIAFRPLLDNPTIQKNTVELINAKSPTVPILVENKPANARITRVFERGNRLLPTDTVQAAIPEAFGKTPIHNRLDFAQWLVNPNNALTGRTLVNRVWEQIFGNGLVPTLEDLGSQGDWPTHPELLDNLSKKLMTDYQWSLKKLITEIVNSSTYKQDSRSTPELNELDPQNKWLARGPRTRLTAEQLRDQSLAISGLLSNKMYGPGIMPYQPEGVWQSVYSDAKWILSEREDRYRRAVYTYQKRTSPYPSMVTFDGSSREFCVTQRVRTNTPLQALVTMNDTAYIETHFALALKILQKSATVKEQIQSVFKAALFRAPSEMELNTLVNLYNSALTKVKLVPAKQSPGNPKSTNTAPEARALAVVVSTIFNLDEFLTH